MANIRKPPPRPGLKTLDPEPRVLASPPAFGPPGQPPSAENLEGGKKSGVLDMDSIRAKDVKTLKPE